MRLDGVSGPKLGARRTRINGRRVSRVVHGAAHLAHGFADADHDGAANDRVADVQLLDFRDRRHEADVGRREPVTGMDGQADTAPLGRRITKRCDAAHIARMMRVLTRVQFNGVGAEITRSANRGWRRRDEQADANACIAQPPNSRLQRVGCMGQVEATLSRDLLATLGDERDLVRAERRGDVEHLRRACHFEIQERAYRASQARDVVILDVAPIFAKVCGDAIRTCVLACEGSRHGVGFIRSARLPNGRHVIDVDVQTLVGCSHHGRGLRFALTDWAEMRMKRIVLALVLLAGCKSAAPREGTEVTGAATPQAAVDRLLAAIRAQDLQALGAVWGDKRGSAREIMQRDEYDQRVIVMQCYFSHDQARIVSGPTTKVDTVLFNLELSKGQMRAATTAKTLQGPGSRWYVLALDPVPRGFCNR